MYFLVFVFGLAIGSFLNVLIFRLPESKNILGFSRCRQCQKEISWYDNIPILSFMILKGRCRKCKTKISLQYPLVELLTGFLFLISFFVYPVKLLSYNTGFGGFDWVNGNLFFLVYILILISFLIVIAFVDLKHLLILDNLILAGFIVSLSYSLLAVGYWPISFYDSFLGMLFFGGIYLFLFLISKGKWLGFGDVKFALWLGFVFGLKNSVDIFYLTFLIGFIFAIILLGFKKANLKTEIPLGTVMAGASILFLLSGFSILDLIDSDLILRLWIKGY